MNWGVVWYIDFADWSIISPCIEAMQTRIKFLSWTRSFTQYVLIQFYGKSEFVKSAGFHSVDHKFSLDLQWFHDAYI